MMEIIKQYPAEVGSAKMGAKCSKCGALEYATPSESKTEFIHSLKLAGWVWQTKAQQWICVKCEVG